MLDFYSTERFYRTMNKPGLPSVVAFDVYDTLAVWRPELAVMASDHGYTLAEVLAGSEDIALRADHGEISYEQFGTLMEQRWGFSGYVERVAKGFQPIEAMHQLAHDFHEAGSRLILASNVGSGALRLTFERQALPHIRIFERIIESCKIGHAKPHPNFFSHVLQVTGVAPSDHLFIDDSHSNVTAAVSAGMQAELVDTNNIAATVTMLRQRYLPDTLVA